MQITWQTKTLVKGGEPNLFQCKPNISYFAGVAVLNKSWNRIYVHYYWCSHEQYVQTFCLLGGKKHLRDAIVHSFVGFVTNTIIIWSSIFCLENYLATMSTFYTYNFLYQTMFLWSCSVNSSQLLPGATTQSCGWPAQQLHSTWFPSPSTHISPPSAFTIQRWSSRDQSFTLIMTKNFYLSSRVLVWDVYEANGLCLEDMEPPFLASLKSWAQTEIYIDKHWHN